MEKIDYKKQFSELYSIKANLVRVVEVPEFNYLMIHGQGDPNTSADYKNAVEALYSVAYAIKFKIKRGPHQIDYGVMPLEGQWWTDDISQFSIDHKELWKWTMSIMQPELVTADLVDQCIHEVSNKKDLPALSRVHFKPFRDGKSAQILHIGPYADEVPTIELLHKYIHQNGYALKGKHREIYLNDPRRSAPEKLKTIIRQPIH